MPSTNEEQLLLEYTNDARLNPMGDAARYLSSYNPLTSGDSDIEQALQYFGVSGSVLLAQFSALTPAQPLAFNDILAGTARVHDQLMIADDAQEHQLPGESDPFQRMTAAGYHWTTAAENIYAYATDVLQDQAAFMVDWGGSAADGGIQTPAGHRENIMNPALREVGIGIVDENNASTEVGPLVTTEDFGTSSTTNVFILGVAYDDTDHNNFYSIGEGLAGLVVSVGTGSTTSSSSGGYTLSTNATGKQTITLSGAGLSGTVSLSATLAADNNYKIDVIDGHILHTSISVGVSGPVDTIVGLGLTGLTLSAGSGTQTLTGTPGNDTLDGGSGVDTASYDVTASAASFARNANGTWTVNAGADGTDTLHAIEIVQFADRSVSLVALGQNRTAFDGSGKSDLLLWNTSGALVTGEVVGGQMSYVQVSALGPEWRFVGAGDYLGTGATDFLAENSVGALVTGAIVNGATTYTAIGGLGPEWQVHGSGNLLGTGRDDFLAENTAGAVIVGDVVNGQASYTAVAALGPEWAFDGTGDFLGNGATGYLIHNTTSGALVLGTISSGTTSFSQVGAFGDEWQYEGTADFLGSTQDDFLLRNTNSGALVVGAVANGSTSYAAIGGLGPEWQFLGTGDFLGTGGGGFAVRDSNSGTMVLGSIVSGQASYTTIGAIGPEWSAKTASTSIG